MEKRLIIGYLLAGLISAGTLNAQTGGQGIFEFVNLSASSRLNALGGTAPAWQSKDASSSASNPALLSDDVHTQFSFQHQFYFADIRNSHVNYVHKMKKWNTFLQGGVKALNSGDVSRTDIYGNTSGTVQAKETDIYLAAARPYRERLSFGAQIHYIYSVVGDASSSGILFNAGARYYNPDKKLALGLVFRNAGTQLDPYVDHREAKSPMKIELGIAQKLKHLPFTYHITLTDLQQWDIRYDDPAENGNVDLLGETKETGALEKAAGNALRHMVFGGELGMGKNENFWLRLGYNHLRARDLALSDYRAFNGLSFGLGLKIYKFKFDYSYAKYHLAGGTSQIGLSFDLNSFVKTKV